MSQTFEVRLAKYAKRGFAVAIPGFDRTLVDFQLFKIPVKEAHGLGKLLLMEMGDLMKHPLLFEVTVPPPQRRVGEGFAPWMFPLYQARALRRRREPPQRRPALLRLVFAPLCVALQSVPELCAAQEIPHPPPPRPRRAVNTVANNRMRWKTSRRC